MNFINKKNRTQDPNAYVPDKGYTYGQRWAKEDARANRPKTKEGPHKHYPEWEYAMTLPDYKAQVKRFIKGGAG